MHTASWKGYIVYDPIIGHSGKGNIKETVKALVAARN